MLGLRNWKLHISRYSDPPYLPPLANGRRNYSLRHPELYNLDLDPADIIQRTVSDKTQLRVTNRNRKIGDYAVSICLA